MRDTDEVTVETFDIREMGPYIGQRIAGTSGDVVEAVLTKKYAFVDRITIRIVDIPARFDRVTGKTYISSRDGRILTHIVRRYTNILRKQRARPTARFRVVPLRVRLNAPDLLAA
ncbi:MAG: hypothetical protein ACR2M3_06020 [Thermomicrobiales bacterium]